MKKIISYFKENSIASAVLVYFGCYLLLGSVIIAISPIEYQIYVRLLITFITWGMMIRCCKPYFEKNFIEDIMQGLDKSIVLGVFTFVLVMIGLLFTSLSNQLTGTTTINQNVIELMAIENPITMGFIIILFLPFSEELLFKDQLFNQTKFLRRSWWLKTLAVASIFASFHCLTEIISLEWTVIISFFNYFIFYVLTNFIVKKYDNLMMAIITHCLYNAVAYILIFH